MADPDFRDYGHKFFVKVRFPGKKRFWFVTPRSNVNALRIHAARFRDEAHADEAIKKLRELNPELEFKRTPIDRST